MLSKCPECELPVSDKAAACPHCGYPLQSSKSRTHKAKKDHMRLPNGFGQISKIKDKNLRKPYRAMVTVGKKDNGRPICKLLKPEGYFETYNDAYLALMEYNKNPYDLSESITVLELYNKWSAEYFAKITDSSKRTITSAWAYCSGVENIMARDIRVGHIKACMDTCESKNVKARIKSMFNLMFDYALEYGIVDKNYARDFKVEPVKAETSHNAFTNDELAILWKNSAIPLVNSVLIQCYMGWRPQELCRIQLSDVNITDWTITGGMKTDAGRDRVVPICENIKESVIKMKSLAESCGSKTLICDYDGKSYTYDRYYKKFMSLMEELNIANHRPHDPRKTFITMCKNAGVDEYAIKYMAGHAIDDITEALYTERDPAWLSKEIEKIIGAV